MNAETKLIDIWEQFVEYFLTPIGVIPETTQYIEVRRAFYSGAHSAVNLTLSIAELDEEEAIILLNAVDEELKDFCAKIGTEGF